MASLRSLASVVLTLVLFAQGKQFFVPRRGWAVKKGSEAFTSRTAQKYVMKLAFDRHINCCTCIMMYCASSLVLCTDRSHWWLHAKNLEPQARLCRSDACHDILLGVRCKTFDADINFLKLDVFIRT